MLAKFIQILARYNYVPSRVSCQLRIITLFMQLAIQLLENGYTNFDLWQIRELLLWRIHTTFISVFFRDFFTLCIYYNAPLNAFYGWFLSRISMQFLNSLLILIFFTIYPIYLKNCFCAETLLFSKLSFFVKFFCFFIN